MQVRSLGGVDFERIYKAFSDAYGDYEVRLDDRGLLNMLQRRGYDASLSFAAFEGEDIVSFVLNGTGTFNGVGAAYDIGTGTVKRYRGQGLAARIFGQAIPRLKVAGLKHYLLEVLKHNTSAIALYRKVGFEVTREFNYYVWNGRVEDDASGGTGSICSVREMEMAGPLDVSDCWDFHPSWQNSFESIHRAAADLVCLGAYKHGKRLGYCVLDPHTGDIAQIAVEKGSRRLGVGSLLLREAQRLSKAPNTKLINVDAGCGSLTAFLASKNIKAAGGQLEMMKTI